MKYHVYNDSTWLYPDTVVPEQTESYAADLARGGTVGVQLLTDVSVSEAVAFTSSFEAADGITVKVFQLMPALVEKNSGPLTHTAENYADVAHFVTREAPFEVYDVTRPIDDHVFRPGRMALFLLFSASENVQKGRYGCRFNCQIGAQTLDFPIELCVSAAKVPSLDQAQFFMVNWLALGDVAQAHNLERGSEAFWTVVGKYLDNQLDLRTNHIMLPKGEPVYDDAGRIVDFDFSECEKLGEMALAHGFTYIYGGFVARWNKWDEPGIYFLWDRGLSVETIEGYRQLSIYYKKLWSIVEKHGWQNQWMQCLVDEPQFANSQSYRALAGICRKYMPGVTIHDPVESTELGGAVDIWCVKQSLYEQKYAEYRRLQDMGEKMAIYTCGFPAGKTMNRATDLPLLAGRLPMWMTVRYDCIGFLHWGYNAYGGVDPFTNNCYPREPLPLPPGDGFIVYPGDDMQPWNTVRAHLQRSGAEEAELLMQLPKDVRDGLIGRVCTSFDDYTSDPAVFQRVRHDLLSSF